MRNTRIPRSRALKVITGYTCDTFIHPDKGEVLGKIFPTLQDYADAHRGRLSCELVKVVIRIDEIPQSPQEKAVFEKIRRKRAEEQPW